MGRSTRPARTCRSRGTRSWRPSVAASSDSPVIARVLAHSARRGVAPPASARNTNPQGGHTNHLGRSYIDPECCGQPTPVPRTCGRSVEMNPKAHARSEPPMVDRSASGRRSRWRMLAVVLAALVATALASGVALARTTATRIGNGVVVIKTTLGYQRASAAGTGMVLTSSGEILTNNHVIRGATKITVVVPGTSYAYTANVVGYDVAD